MSAGLPHAVWAAVLARLSDDRDVASVRSTCRAWCADANATLRRLRLRRLGDCSAWATAAPPPPQQQQQQQQQQLVVAAAAYPCWASAAAAAAAAAGAPLAMCCEPPAGAAAHASSALSEAASVLSAMSCDSGLDEPSCAAGAATSLQQQHQQHLHQQQQPGGGVDALRQLLAAQLTLVQPPSPPAFSLGLGRCGSAEQQLAASGRALPACVELAIEHAGGAGPSEFGPGLAAACGSFGSLQELELRGYSRSSNCGGGGSSSSSSVAAAATAAPDAAANLHWVVTDLSGLSACVRLRRLRLQTCVLACSLAPLRALAQLTSLELADSHLEGVWDRVVHEELPQLGQLQALRLDTGACTPAHGALQALLVQLPRLSALHLRASFLGAPWHWQELAAAAQLTALTLHVKWPGRNGNFSPAAVLPPLGHLPLLQRLELSGFRALCDRDFALLSQISGGLTSLALAVTPPAHASVGAAGVAAAAARLRGLRRLALAHCGLDREALRLAVAGGAWPLLERLRLEGACQLDDAPLLGWCRGALEGVGAGAWWRRLCDLDLSGGCAVSDLGVSALTTACGASLTRLHLGGSCARLTDWGVAQLAASARALRWLSLRDGGGGVTCAGVGALAAARPPLEHLDVSGCGCVGDAGIAAVARGLTRLTSLDAEWCGRVTNRSVRCLAALPELRELRLTGTLFAPHGADVAPLVARLGGALHCVGEPALGVQWVM